MIRRCGDALRGLLRRRRAHPAGPRGRRRRRDLGGRQLLPKQWSELVDAALRGDWATARALHYALLPLIRALFLETNPIPIKAAMAMLGYCRDELRLPLLPMSDGPRQQLRAALLTKRVTRDRVSAYQRARDRVADRMTVR